MKFFNTSGLLYKSMELKNKLSEMAEEQLKLLITDEIFVKRMLVIGDSIIFAGLKESEWDYTIVLRQSQNTWANLSTYFKYPQEIRTLIYTTNSIEGFNRQLRKVTKNKGIFPTDESLLKMLFLAMMDITKKWTGKRREWDKPQSQKADLKNQWIALSFWSRIRVTQNWGGLLYIYFCIRRVKVRRFF